MSRKFINLLFLSSIFCIFLSGTKAYECLSTNHDDHFKCHLGSRTPYRYVANYNDSQLNYSGCTAKKLWLLTRHGARFPGKKVISSINQELPKLKQLILRYYKVGESKIPAETIDQLVNWKLTVNMDDAMKLKEEGERELIDLAERFQSRFPTLLPEIYSNHTYKLKYTPTQRTEESANHFTVGLFGRQASRKVWYHPPEQEDSVLRSYKHCHRWRSEVKNNPAANKQIRLFKRTNIVQETLDEISGLLGFAVNYDTANLIYSVCGYETAWEGGANSPWCKFLSLENFQVIEYANDLQYFWIDGYGFPLTFQQSCPALRDMFHFFQSSSDQKATLYFSHSGAILKLIALLGLAKDKEQVTHNSFKFHRHSRAWRASRIDAFASNIGFLLYECEESPSILIMQQERIVQIPGCPDNVPCPISIIEEKFSDSIHNCQFENMCDLRSV